MILKTVYLLLLKKLDLDQIAFFDHNLMEWYGHALRTSGQGSSNRGEHCQAAGVAAQTVTTIQVTRGDNLTGPDDASMFTNALFFRWLARHYARQSV